jgi:hypothetical protein
MEFAAAPETALALKPANLSFEEAASIPTTGWTALQGLRKGRIERGRHVLIHGASGGVGTFAAQLARTFGAELTDALLFGPVPPIDGRRRSRAVPPFRAARAVVRPASSAGHGGRRRPRPGRASSTISCPAPSVPARAAEFDALVRVIGGQSARSARRRGRGAAHDARWRRRADARKLHARPCWLAAAVGDE